MVKTQHIQARMSQRGIKQEMIDIAMQYGEVQQDKVIINRKGLLALQDKLTALQKTAQAMMKKGGMVVVQADGHLITTYDLNSYRRCK